MGGTQPASINERGQIVGLGYDARGGSRGFLLHRGAFTLLDGTLGATYTRALDVNNRGQIVGDYGTRPRMGDSSASARPLDLATDIDDRGRVIGIDR